MMSMEMIMAMVEGLGEDVDMRCVDDCIQVVVQDLDYYSGDERIYDEDAVDAVYDKLEEEALQSEGDFYRYFQFDCFYVQWAYASYDM